MHDGNADAAGRADHRHSGTPDQNTTDGAPSAAAQIPVSTNMLICTVVLSVHASVLFVIPMTLLPENGKWVWAIVLLPLVTPTHWALLHEAIHANLHPARKVNRPVGRLLGIAFGSPYSVLRFGHITHHALNGKFCDRPEIYDPKTVSHLKAARVYYTRLFIGLYGVEVLANLLALLPKRRLPAVVRRFFHEGSPEAGRIPDIAVRQLLPDDRLLELRIDAFAVLCVYGVSALLYGGYFWVVILALMGRGLVVSFLDGAPHYGSPVEDVRQGYDLSVPRPLARLILYANLHGTHHRHPNAPWNTLPGHFESDRAQYDGRYLLTPLRQLAGPIAAGRLFESRINKGSAGIRSGNVA